MIVRHERCKQLANELTLRLTEDRDSLGFSITIPTELAWQIVEHLEIAARATDMGHSGASVSMPNNASAH